MFLKQSSQAGRQLGEPGQASSLQAAGPTQLPGKLTHPGFVCLALSCPLPAQASKATYHQAAWAVR